MMSNDCIKYCIIKARSGNTDKVVKQIGKALIQCDKSKQSIHEAIILLKVLEDEG